ncbi:MAG: imidazole glycerol phosphate synthase subunit HisH [Rikenellaceae bacterium]
MLIAIINYGVGNLRSLENVFIRHSLNYIITSNPEDIAAADKIILPGVGAAKHAMQKLEEYSLVDVIKSSKQPLMGICLGMQLLCSHSEEEDVDCLGIVPNRVKLLQGGCGIKVPHIGWNSVEHNGDNLLYNGINSGEYFYYVHSYGVEVNDYTIATTTNGDTFSASINKDNFYGCQFHPEKSGDIGEKLLLEFVRS